MSNEITLDDLKADLLANPVIRAAYRDMAPEFEAAATVIRARALAGLTQAELAARIGTSQSAIARLEGGKVQPSLKMLHRIAQAAGARLRVTVEAAD